MKTTLIFPSAILAMSLAASLVYAAHSDVKRAVYWAAAAAIAWSVM